MLLHLAAQAFSPFLDPFQNGVPSLIKWYVFFAIIMSPYGIFLLHYKSLLFLIVLSLKLGDKGVDCAVMITIILELCCIGCDTTFPSPPSRYCMMLAFEEMAAWSSTREAREWGQVLTS